MLIDKMDPKGYILYRLYQGHMRYADGERVKVSTRRRSAFDPAVSPPALLTCFISFFPTSGP